MSWNSNPPPARGSRITASPISFGGDSGRSTPASASRPGARPPARFANRGAPFSTVAANGDDDDVGAVGELTPRALDRILRAARSDGRLNLAHRGLRGSVPAAVWHMYDPPSDADVSLDRARRPDASAAWWEAVDLTRLVLADNLLEELDPKIAQFGALEVLDLHNNRLAALPDAIGALERLVNLNAASNKLLAIPPSLASLANLTVLALNDNSIAEFPAAVAATLTKLTSLDLGHNRLTTLPDLSACQFLATLRVPHNRLPALPPLPPSLRDLDVSTNLIAALPDAWELPVAERIDLRHNRLAAVTTLAAAPRLKELYLSFNQLTAVDLAPAHPALLATLDLRDNKLAAVPPAILDGKSLPDLRRLDLQNNDIKVANPELGFLPLHSLLLEGNLIRGLPRDGGTVALLAWLRDKMPAPGSVGCSPWSLRPRGPRVPVAHPDADAARASPSRTPTPTLPAEPTPADEAEPAAARALTADMTRQGLTAADVAAMLAASPSLPASMDLSHNPLAAIPDLAAAFRSLTSLTLTHAGLTGALPATLPLPPFLESLDLSHNALTSLTAALALSCGTPAALHTLCVSFNSLGGTLATDWAAFPRLAVLVLSNNRLAGVDAGVLAATAPDLHTLDVSNNAIGRLDPALARVRGLQILRVDGNTFRVPRYDIVARGSDAVIKWCHDRLPAA
ncbi:hypothetical protein H9P43_002817 [Blastocladiella emersonii ATCC 22665]|nr:hypothetical protein H9P43_002817 [Blastocladiella emersonii ATCC 22665]